MPIIRNKNILAIDTEPFTNKQLSYGARGVLVTLLTCSDDINIEVDDLLARSIKDEASSIKRYLNELRTLGYLKEISEVVNSIDTDKTKHSHEHENNSQYNSQTLHPRNSDYDREFSKKYRSTKEWRGKRRSVFERDNYRCVKCNSNKRLCCHHLTYENLGHESLSDLQTLCTSCHAKLHRSEFFGKGNP